ncbi:MAG: DUF1559 domain-containing protein [Thermoguttaceae bacterium]|jgi:prepilin-type N-terminal cleavage/methylation domain-containing protein
MSTHRHGFTLVELLVVIVIIGLLMALLLPAVRSATESSRQAVCMNNVKELGTAIMSYESEKGRLPGYINPASTYTGGSSYVTWPMAILPKLSRQDILDQARNQSGKWANVQISQFICPDDPQKGVYASAGPQDTSGNYYYSMSYVVPAAYFLNRSQATSTSGPTCQIGQIVNPTQTVMLGERTWIPSDPGTHAIHAPAWTDATTTDPNGNTNAGGALTFTWPANGQTPPITPTVLGSKHPGIVIVQFFDGHGEKVRDDNPTNVDASGNASNGLLVPQ